MAKYIVQNITHKDLQLIIPAPIGSNRNSAVFTLKPQQILDLVPWTGSVYLSKTNPEIKKLVAHCILRVVEE